MKILTRIDGYCAPSALKYLLDLPDDKILDACLKQGQFDEQWIAAAKLLGLKIENLNIKRTKVKNFIKKRPEGVFLACTHNHIFVIDNGKVIDPLWRSDGLYRMLLSAHRVI